MKNLSQTIKNLKQSVEMALEDSMKRASHDVLQAIFEARTWDDDTFNLRDSFALAIYKHGVEIHREYLDVQMATRPYKIRGAIKNYTGIQYTTGRSQVNAFLDDYDAPSNITYHIVFVAGMYYAIFLQDYHNMLFGFIRGEKIAISEFKKAIRNTSFIRYKQ